MARFIEEESVPKDPDTLLQESLENTEFRVNILFILVIIFMFAVLILLGYVAFTSRDPILCIPISGPLEPRERGIFKKTP